MEVPRQNAYHRAPGAETHGSAAAPGLAAGSAAQIRVTGGTNFGRLSGDADIFAIP